MDVKIDWMDGWGNHPVFQISDVEYPGWPLSTTPIWEQQDGIHRADHGIFVHYFYSDGKPTTGYGGARFHGTFQSGETFEYIGAWSSRASVVNLMYPNRKIVDVTLIEGENSHRACALKAQVLITWWRENRPDWGLAWCVDNTGESILLPTRNGQLKDTLSSYVVVNHLIQD